jgi:glycerol-3-phosphate O-acyltransferase
MIIAILIFATTAFAFTSWNLLKKVERYEEIIEENDTFIQEELEKNEALLEALRRMDDRQMFEKDDDVGSIFSLIKETIEKFKNKTKSNA